MCNLCLQVLGCLKLVCHPSVSITDFSSSVQLEQLLRMCVRQEGIPPTNWSSEDHWVKHAGICLLQDLVTGEHSLVQGWQRMVKVVWLVLVLVSMMITWSRDYGHVIMVT